MAAGFLALGALLAGCAGEPLAEKFSAPTEASDTPAPSPSAPAQTLLSQEGIAAGHPEAVKVGLEILEQGGNAADAAIATAFAVSVVEPHASGIGGGGVTLVAEPTKDVAAFDYREVVGTSGKIPASGTGVPGFVDGMATLHETYGSMPWDELLQPAEDLARDGFVITKFLGERMNDGIGSQIVSEHRQFRTKDGSRVLREGETLKQSELAQTIQTIAEGGRDEFYEGSISDELTEVEGLDATTLANYETEKFEPVDGKVGDYTVVTAPPALPGAGLIQMLQQAEGAGIASDAPGSAPYVDKLMAAWSNASDTVTENFGDQRFVDVDLSEVLDRDQNLAIGSKLEERASKDSPAGDIDPGNTTHLSVVDRDGMAVSMTNTITSFWGGTKSDVVGGFFLNNQLSRFESIDSPANRPEPGRKSVTWSNPAMVLDGQGRVVMGIGTPGGQQIPNILASVLVPVLLQDQPIQDAVDGPRFHLQGGTLAVEGKAGKSLKALARANEWKIRETTRSDGVFGSIQALWVDYDTGTLDGATDVRRDGDHGVADTDQ
ncbi:gamma-glutamyltransferase [Paeniglutamicibacter sulfureus]|uniref:Gamma-glutamyltranspeptidase/glutathione hydrolase n=1 Tax=Paeniglutamicibacter sulfureus TaxID=43666 RepID=A0ABU2BLJ7_9MICC|nr:gamma-glutamyltransferase [Paeniglutamicibacter sulfureus]MDR7359493.1 gamma-glutamyltranspeptidase/glutathione hydrolase [Paeniglutamicibacter sulfureus]